MTSNQSENFSDDENHKIVTDLFIKKNGPFFGFCIKGGIYKPLGIYVTKVDKDGVADRAGLKPEDEILSVNDRNFTDMKIHEALEYLLHLKTALVRVKRDPSFIVPYSPPQNLAKIQIARSSLTETFGFTVKSLIEDEIFKKLVVTSVLDGSPSKKSQLEIGDEIIEVNDRKLRTLGDFYDIVQIFRGALVLVLIVNKKIPERKVSVQSQTNSEYVVEPETRTLDSSHRLESIISQLSDSDLNESSDVEKAKFSARKSFESNEEPARKSPNLRRKSRLNKPGFIPNSYNHLDTKRRFSKQLKTNNYDNNPRHIGRRSSSIQNILDALNMVSLEESESSESSDGEKRAQDWQVPFVDSTYLITQCEKSTKPNVNQKSDSSDSQTINKQVVSKKTPPTGKSNNNPKSETETDKEVTAFSLLPCSSEIWLPSEDSLLNIESETVIPETVLPSQLVTDYEYKYPNNESDRMNSMRYGTYKSKFNSARVEIKPDGVLVVRVVKTAESKDRFGLRLRRDGGDFIVCGVDLGSEAHRLGIFQIGQTIIEIDPIDQTVSDFEKFIEDVYSSGRPLEITLKLKN